MRRRRLAALGVSLAEQRMTPARELSEILAVDDVIRQHEADEIDRARKD